MRIFFTKKQLNNYLEEERAALDYARANYNYYAAKWDYIQALLNIDFREMDTDEIKKFFKYNPDVRHKDYSDGMKAGINIIIDVFETCGIAKKKTLEKLRWRAHKQIEKETNENDS